MRITKRQLRQTILETMSSMDLIDDETILQQYKKWAVEYMGSPAGANSSSVLATFLVDQGLDQGPMADNIMKDIAREMRFDIVDVRRAVGTAREEYDAGGVLSEPEDLERGFKEGKMRVTKRQLRRIIKEEKRKLLREQPTADAMGDLLSLLGQAEGVASMLDQDDPYATGQEGQELSAALQDIWVAFGGEPGEIFK